jgi:hypothetical protein
MDLLEGMAPRVRRQGAMTPFFEAIAVALLIPMLGTFVAVSLHSRILAVWLNALVNWFWNA